MSEKPHPGKIIIDSDWKEQVAQEKEQLRKQHDPDKPDSEDSAGQNVSHGEIPEASFLILVVNMATQAMSALGQIPDPMTGEVHQDLEVAKFHIDMLGMLQEKSRGNLDAEESRYLEATLTQLRLAFVQLSQRRV